MQVQFLLNAAGPQLIIEIVPDWVMVGIGGNALEGPVQGRVVVAYRPEDLGFIRDICAELRKQGKSPRVAVEESNVCISYSLSPVPSELLRNFRRSIFFDILVEDVTHLHAGSVADCHPESPEHMAFNRCFVRDAMFELNITDTTAKRASGVSVGTAFERFTLRELGNTISPIVD